MNTNAMAVVGETSVIPVPHNEAVAFVHMIERAARDPAVNVEKLERLAMMRREALLEQAEEDFNAAMSAIQGKMRAVAADANNPQTKSRYASYHALDKAIRPIYSAEGMALSFDTEDSPKPDHIRVVCYVTRGRFTRKYKKDEPADGKGAKGGDVMTKTHAGGAALTYGQRYLLKMIFNIAVGDDNDGNAVDAPTAITGDQIETIKKLTQDFDSDTMTGFLKYVGAETINGIPPTNYDKAMYAIGMKKGQRK